jgi:hypothetical protein
MIAIDHLTKRYPAMVPRIEHRRGQHPPSRS